MEDPQGPSMGTPIYYVGLACSCCSWCSLGEHPEHGEHFCSWCSFTLAKEPGEHLSRDPRHVCAKALPMTGTSQTTEHFNDFAFS